MRKEVFLCFRATVVLCGASGVCKNDNYTNTIDNSRRATHYLLAVVAPGALQRCGCDNRRTVQAENVKLYRQSCLKQLCTRNEHSQFKLTVKNC